MDITLALSGQYAEYQGDSIFDKLAGLIGVRFINIVNGRPCKYADDDAAAANTLGPRLKNVQEIARFSRRAAERSM